MSTPPPLRLALVGCGGMSRHHLRNIVKMSDRLRVTAMCEPNVENYKQAAAILDEADQIPPARSGSVDALLRKAGSFDAAFIITPHNEHLPQASALLQAGKHVLLEKPMVLNVREAKALMRVHKASGKTLMIAFNGSASPNIRTAVRMLRAGELGKLLSIHATVWQDWQKFTNGTWRQVPKISGGGFLFDTGAHLLNTVADLLGEPVVELSAFMDNCGAPVDLKSAIIGRTASGVTLSLNATGNTDHIGSDVRVICEEGTLLTGVWGEHLQLRRAGMPDFTTIETPASLGVVELFMQVVAGQAENPCPPEIGLRMIAMHDAARKSARTGGAMIKL